jgi:hypothetical protein
MTREVTRVKFDQSLAGVRVLNEEVSPEELRELFPGVSGYQRLYTTRFGSLELVSLGRESEFSIPEDVPDFATAFCDEAHRFQVLFVPKPDVCFKLSELEVERVSAAEVRLIATASNSIGGLLILYPGLLIRFSESLWPLQFTRELTEAEQLSSSLSNRLAKLAEPKPEVSEGDRAILDRIIAAGPDACS